MNILGHGVYSLPEAARLTRLKAQRVREWFGSREKDATRKSVFRSDYRPIDGDNAISFLDLIDLFVVGQLRNHGVALQSLRKVYSQLKKDLNTPHPFCRQEVLTDGKNVFTLGLDDQNRSEMIEVLTQQRVFAEILLPFLKRIDYDDATRLARRWCIADRVVIDPSICFGKPIVSEVGMATSILATAYDANGKNAEVVAGWYDIHAKHVIAAVDFEQSFAA